MTVVCQPSATVDRGLKRLLITIVVAGFCVCIQPGLFPSVQQRLIQRIALALELRRPEAYLLAQELMTQPGSGAAAIALAADSAAIAFEHDAAVALYEQLPRDEGCWQFHAHLGLARRFEIRGQIAGAEAQLRRALELNPYDIEANSRLGHLLQVTDRSSEGAPCFFKLILLGKCRGDELLAVAAPERFHRGDEHLSARGLGANPPEAGAELAIAKELLFNNRQAEAEVLLRKVIAAAPHFGEAHGRLGRIIFDRNDLNEFLTWIAGLPDDVRDHAEVWYIQGLQARRLGQVEGATRCFLETLRRSPNHVGATVQIAGCLSQANQHEIATQFVRRSETLANIDGLLNQLRGNVDIELIKKTIGALADAGRFWEAAGWAYVLSQIDKAPVAEAQQQTQRWLALAKADFQQDSPRLDPATWLRLSDFSVPRWPDLKDVHQLPDQLPADSIQWKFRDDAEQAGVRFRYFEGTTEETRLQHIFNVVGGGLAATDFDLDGWCDLYLAQANNWRDSALQKNYPDRLFRNLAGDTGKFQDVTMASGLGDLGFSHGVCAADFDQDGFPDLYIGNLGPNRLYRNNGDGTFSDITVQSGTAGHEWTTSSTLADFNADGLPDLYVANYSLIKETAEKICKRDNGELMACTPDVLTAEVHRFYINLGDGTFRDVTAQSGMQQPNGRGLGLVAWDFAGNGRLGLFVANDTSPNFLFMNQGLLPDGIPEFHEEALVRGVALDPDGKAQACMGVAAGDANGDGWIDLFITNFFGEQDTLYSQRPDGLFDDATRPCDLRDAGFWTLGFGCQFADFDGDGWEDLIVTNGHVDQKSRRGDPDRMPPQFFRNLGGRKFAEIPAEQLGPFFQRGHLGRGLAKLDWNRDGRMDFAVSHLHEDFALVTNTTESSGRSLMIRLVGRTTPRDPVGATIKIRAGNRDLYRLLTAGDGYLVTNERMVEFAVPADESSVEIEVKWPGGRIERWPAVPPGHEILILEGRARPIVLRSFTSPSEDP